MINTFTTCSVGSQTDLAFLLEYVKSLQVDLVQKAPSPPPPPLVEAVCQTEPDKLTVEKDEERIISPSTLSVPQKVRLFEQFTNRMTSSMTAPAQLYTPQAWVISFRN